MNHVEYCRRVRSGIAHQRISIQGFLALARKARNMGLYDLEDLMLSQAAAARISYRILRLQERRRCYNNNNNNLL